MKRLLTALIVALAVTPATSLASDEAAGGGPAVEISVLPPAPVRVGEQFTLTYVFKYAEGARVYFPEKPDTAPLVFVRIHSDRPAVLGTGTTEKHSVTVMAVRTGTTAMKPFDIPIVAADGSTGMVTTPEVPVTVASSIGNENSPEPARFDDPAPLIVRNDLLLWVLGAILVAAIAAGVAILGYRRYRAWVLARTPPPPPEPPEVRAWRRLAEIEAMGLIESFQFKELALRLSEVVREFLGARMGFPGADSTTWETMDFVKAAGPGGNAGRLDSNELDDLLSLCDLIKFAKFQPTASDGAALMRRSRQVVDSVMAFGPSADPEPAVAPIVESSTRGGGDAV